jgi:hypothetical protein
MLLELMRIFILDDSKERKFEIEEKIESNIAV